MTCKRTARRPPALARVTIDSLAFGGDGVGRDQEGRVLFVPNTAPGDVVEVEIEEEKKSWARGRLLRVLRPSPARVEPVCPLVPECGGCQWQHVALDAQRAAKEDIVRRALRRVVDQVEPIVTPTAAFGWRRRARLRWRRGATLVVGYAARRSHRLVDVAACPQLEPALERELAAIRARDLQGSGEIEMLASRTGQVAVALKGTGIIATHPALRAGAQQVSEPIDLGGGFWASPELFAQVSAAGNDALRRLVLAAAEPLAGARVLELYAGSGNFTRDLAAGAASVVAVEESGPAAALAARNLAAFADRVEWRTTAADAVAGQFDVVVVDPPRTGLAAGLPERLAALRPRRIIYVSCDPATLARDLEIFKSVGYLTSKVTPIDMMPQTFHVEVVAVLVPAKSALTAG